MADVPEHVWKAGLAKQDADARAASAEADRIAKEKRKAYLAEQGARIREEQAARVRVNDAARDPSGLERELREARQEAASAKAHHALIDPADIQARLASAEAVASAAKAAFDLVEVRAKAALIRATGEAGTDPVRRAKAQARAQSDWAEALGSAEADYEAASFEADRTAIFAARAAKVANHRIRAAEARLAEKAKAEADPLRLSNPFADPVKPTITMSQYESIRDPALRARAAKEADIVDDDDPPFTRDDVEAVLRARGSTKRLVFTRSELASLSPADQMQASRTAIIVDD